jgi:L,D-transpeptidase YcbB
MKHINPLIIITIVLFAACKQKDVKTELLKKDVDITIPQQIKPVTSLVFDSSFQQVLFTSYPQLATIQKDWLQFYTKRNYSFAWIDTGGLTLAAHNIHNRINNLMDDGLNDSLLYRKEFNQLFNDATTLTGKEMSDSTLIATEMMLTAQYFMYVKAITSTLGENELKKMGWNISQRPISYEEYLNKALQSKTAIFENEPVYYQYALLRNYLKQYKEIEYKGGFPVIDSTAKNILPNETNKALFNIKAYLTLVGDLKKNDSSNTYDDLTATAIKQFRLRHGLKDTTLIDKTVVQQMNVPVAKRIEQILINMERCKWMPHNPGDNYISVNIPDYTMSVYENNKLNFTINVVVGALATKTVIFSDTLKIIAFSPYWNVPYSIFKKEFRGRSAASLRRNNMEYYGASQVRQLPGGNNALGKVKFLFPNQYNIYFHDTPAKDKFNFTQRAFSHGCIRLKEPKKLAQYLLRNESSYTEAIIDSLMNQKKETQVKLKKPIEVFIGYFTSFVNSQNGLLQFRKDIYANDEAVLKNMLRK